MDNRGFAGREYELRQRTLPDALDAPLCKPSIIDCAAPSLAAHFAVSAHTMADDFARLVFQSNPAASHNSQYQRANDGYPPSGPPGDSHASPQLLDPFFDDEDEGEVPDSAFAGAHSMQVKESNLHLPSQVAPLAGTSKLSLQTNGGGVPQGWTFDQEDSPTLVSQPPRKPKKEKPSRRRWKWPWQKEQILTGERVVALNKPDANVDFPSNYVSTTKYNMATFVPKFLFGSPLRFGCPLPLRLTSAFTHSQSNSPNTPIYSSFSPLASSKFLVSLPPTNGLPLLPCPSSSLRLHSRRSRKTSCVLRPIFSFASDSPYLVRNDTNLTPTLIPVAPKSLPRLALSARQNGRTSKSVMSSGSRATTLSRQMSFFSVQVNRKGFATLKLPTLTGVHTTGTVLVQFVTYFVLSETNLKIKQASPHTSDLTSPNLVTTLRGSLRSEHPNNSLYTYEGTLDLITSTGFPKQVPLGPDQMLLRGAQLRNTPWAYGLVVFTGHETKLMRNARWVDLQLQVWCSTG